MNAQEYAAWRDACITRLLAKEKYGFVDLCDIVTILRGEGGCPWDREQDHHSIRKGMIEECYEVVEAIDRDDPVLLREELGDVLLQIVFHADIEKDAGRFDVENVAHDECVKMIHRHPHVFGQVKADTSEEVLKNWEKIKTVEKQRNSLSEQLSSIPAVLPALMRAQKVGKKMDADADLTKKELIDRCHTALDALATADGETAPEVMGELFFRLTTLCRKYSLEAEEILTQATDRTLAEIVNRGE